MDKVERTIATEIRKNFLTGLFVVLPVFITLWVIWFFISKIITFSLIFLPKDASAFPKFLWSIFVIVLSVIGITFIGITARNVIGKKLLKFAERIIRRIPLVKWIYETAKKIFEPFLSRKKIKIFEKVVLVEYPRQGLYSIGFITAKIGKRLIAGEEPHVNVFIPTSPTPMSGFLIIVPEKDVIPLDIRVEEAIKYFISIGTIPWNVKPELKHGKTG